MTTEIPIKEARIEVLNHYNYYNLPEMRGERLTNLVCKLWNVSVESLMAGRRTDAHADATSMLCAVMSEDWGYTNSLIGRVLGKHPSTIHHALRRHRDSVMLCPGYITRFNKLLQAL